MSILASLGSTGILRHGASNIGQAVPFKGLEFVEQADRIPDGARVGRIDEWEGLDVAESEGAHGKDHRGEIRAGKLGIGKGRARRELPLR